MIRLFANAQYDFIKWRRWAFSLTGAIMLVGLGFLVTRGVNYSPEFTGGTQVQVEAAHKVPLANVRAALEHVGLKGAEVKNFGSDTSFVVPARIGAASAEGEAGTQAVADAVARAFDQSVGAGQFRIERREAVGPKVGRELQGKALLAILFSFLVTLIYLAVRFEWRVGLAAGGATAPAGLGPPALITGIHLPGNLFRFGAVVSLSRCSLDETL